MSKEITRCAWATKDEKMTRYHDEVWGIPEHNDQKLFAKLCLDCMQSGLSWSTILNKQESFEKAFDSFDIKTVAAYDEAKCDALMLDASIVRNRMKIHALINNAKRTLEVQQEFGSFDAYIWGFTNGEVIKNQWTSIEDIPTSTTLSETISKDLKRRSFKFTGPTVIYAYLQAIGVVSDHVTDCYCYNR